MKPGIRQHEHEFEPQYGLPERLPAGERLLWQGAPDWPTLARESFHVSKLALYFGVILLLRATSVLGDGGSGVEAWHALVVLAPLFALGLGLAALLAWLTARTSAYTLTDKRVVMRIGIVLSVTYNLPLRCIERADLRPLHGHRGDIALALVPGTRIAYLHLWPHARPWKLTHTQPMLRCLPDAQRAAALLAQAWTHANGSAAQPVGPAAAAAQPGPATRPAMAAR
jgi:hypothetical protein